MYGGGRGGVVLPDITAEKPPFFLPPISALGAIFNDDVWVFFSASQLRRRSNM